MSWLEILIGLKYASIGSVLIPIACYFSKKKRGVVVKILFSLLLASLASDLGNEFYIRSGLRGYVIYNLFFVVQIILIGLIYFKIMRPKIILQIIFMFTIVFILHSIFFQSINEYQSIIRLIGGLIVIGLSLAFCYKMYRSPSVENIFGHLPSWISIAVLFYFSFNLFLFISANYVFTNSSQDVGMVFWGFHNLNNIVKNCILAVGLFLSDDQKS